MPWISDGTGVLRGGDIGGEGQRGESFCVRFFRQEDGTTGRQDFEGETLFSVLTLYFYGETRIEDEYDKSDVAKDSEGMPILWMTTKTERMVCTNREDPGSSERWCDYSESESERSFTTIGMAETYAKLFAESYTSDLANRDVTWDGLAPWERAS